MTETLGPHSGGPRENAEPEELVRPLPDWLVGSFGAPLRGFEHKIVDPTSGDEVGSGEIGEVCVRGYSMMASQYKRERWELFDDDGWFHTGDLAALRHGYLFFTGRLNEMIKTRGANVSPREVEAALQAVEGIHDAFVVGVSTDGDGQTVAAAVVATEDCDLDIEEIKAQLREELSPYNVPTRIRVLRDDEVPWLPTGKPDKRRIAELINE